MTIDKKYLDEIINVTSKAAIAASYLVGKKNKIAALKKTPRGPSAETAF